MTQPTAAGMELCPTGFDHNNLEKNRIKATGCNRTGHIQSRMGQGGLDLEARPCLGYGKCCRSTVRGGLVQTRVGPFLYHPRSPVMRVSRANSKGLKLPKNGLGGIVARQPGQPSPTPVTLKMEGVGPETV